MVRRAAHRMKRGMMIECRTKITIMVTISSEVSSNLFANDSKNDSSFGAWKFSFRALRSPVA
jgi:hypothetical protein